MPQGAIANGTIYPMRFVKLDTAAITAATPGSNTEVLLCGAGDRSIGISQRGTRRASYIDSNNYAATVGEPLQYFDQGEECYLELGGTVSPGDYLKASTLGVGIKAGTDADAYGAVAIGAGVSGDFIPVKVVYGERGATS